MTRQYRNMGRIIYNKILVVGVQASYWMMQLSVICNVHLMLLILLCFIVYFTLNWIKKSSVLHQLTFQRGVKSNFHEIVNIFQVQTCRTQTQGHIETYRDMFCGPSVN